MLSYGPCTHPGEYSFKFIRAVLYFMSKAFIEMTFVLHEVLNCYLKDQLFGFLLQ